MISVKAILEKQWYEFCKYVKDFVLQDSDTNNEDYNRGRYEILNRLNIDFFDPTVEYYCVCNDLNLRDIPRGIDNVFAQ